MRRLWHTLFGHGTRGKVQVDFLEDHYEIKYVVAFGRCFCGKVYNTDEFPYINFVQLNLPYQTHGFIEGSI